MTRIYTNKLIELIDEGLLDPRDVVIAALCYMSEAEVKEMAEENEFVIEEEDYDL